MRAALIAALLVAACAGVALAAEEGKLPAADRVSFQTAFPGQEKKYRMPTFMDVFASFSQTEYINVGLKWNVAESKAAMAYATRASIGHAPIKEATDDYHIEAFSSSNSPTISDFTKIRFRQKDAYSGSIGYAAPDSNSEGWFQVWDNLKTGYANFKTGGMKVERNLEVVGDTTFNGKIFGNVEFKSESSGDFAGTVIGVSTIAAKIQAEAGKPLAFYTLQKGASADDKTPRMYISDTGDIGVGTTEPKASVHIKASSKAFRVESGTVSVGEVSDVNVDGVDKGNVASGLRFTVKKNGNVGINHNAPDEKLHVNGGVKIDSADTFGPSEATLFVTNAKSGCGDHTLRIQDTFYVSACGKVGVKTPTPGTEFHVTGTITTDNLITNKDANVAGELSVGKFAAHAGHFESKTIKINDIAEFESKMIVGGDAVFKGNLFVQKEVKMVGGGEPDEESEMMMSRLALIDESTLAPVVKRLSLMEESHRSLKESHDAVKEHNKVLQERVADLEKRLQEAPQ